MRNHWYIRVSAAKHSMMKLVKEAGASVALAGLLWTVPAAAADLGGYAPRGSIAAAPVSAPFSWTGSYAGAHAGYAWSGADFGITPTGEWEGNPTAAASLVAGTTNALEPQGFAGGLQIGWNRQTGNFVWGLEADISFLDADASLSGGEIPGTDGVTGFSQNADMSLMATLRLRLGLAMDRTLIFATGGVAWADWDVNTALAAEETTLVSSGSSRSAAFSRTAPVCCDFAVGSSCICPTADTTYCPISPTHHLDMDVVVPGACSVPG